METLTVESFFEKEDPFRNKNYPCSEVETCLFDERDMMIFAERYHESKSAETITLKEIEEIRRALLTEVEHKEYESNVLVAAKILNKLEKQATLKELDKQLNS